MNDIDLKVREILTNAEHLKQLLLLEKQRRHVPPDDLVFVGIANVASHWWCTQQAVFTSRANEPEFFSAWLFDRISNARRLGLMTNLPTSDEALLDVGKEISLTDVEKLLQEEERQAENRGKQAAKVKAVWMSREKSDSGGNRIRLINPNLPPWEKQTAKERAYAEGIRVIELKDDPKWRGEFYEETQAEQYPTIRWNFAWGKYTIVGVPDGIRGDFVYEYKCTGNRFLLSFMKPIALAQGDLYGYFFRRPKKRVQITVVEDHATETWGNAIDVANAEATLSAFAKVDAGAPARPPRAWKCRKCDFQVKCPIRQP